MMVCGLRVKKTITAMRFSRSSAMFGPMTLAAQPDHLARAMVVRMVRLCLWVRAIATRLSSDSPFTKVVPEDASSVAFQFPFRSHRGFRAGLSDVDPTRQAISIACSGWSTVTARTDYGSPWSCSFSPRLAVRFRNAGLAVAMGLGARTKFTLAA
jgi:hypothetical protein